MKGNKPDPFAIWQGAEWPGAMKERRREKRTEAQARNALTLPENRRKYARAQGFSRNSDMLRFEENWGA